MFKRLLILFSVIFFLTMASIQFSIRAATGNLSTVSVTTSDPRPSFRGVLGAGNTQGSSNIIINVDKGAYPSTSSAQLFVNDQIVIGTGASLVAYSVTDVVSDSQFNIAPVLAAASGTTGVDVIASRSATLTVKFKTKNAVPNGKFRVLVPALSTLASSQDGLPDAGAFDYSATPPTVTCPGNTTGYTFSTASEAPSSVTVGSSKYHEFDCPYTGVGGTSTDFTTGTVFSIANIINPAPVTATHTLGTADAYTIIVQHLNNSGTVVDQSPVQIGVVEAVHVTATVDPQISFRIFGIGSGTSACGTATGVTTTATSVPFGSLQISAFTDAAQGMALSTNALNGYVVTAKENDQLANGGVTCTGDGSAVAACIIDSNASGIGVSTAAAWSSTTYKGFGYTLQDPNTTVTEAFNNSNGYRIFADAQASINPITIVSDTVPADNDNWYVCYRAIVSATQAAGNYENYITYTATATF